MMPHTVPNSPRTGWWNPPWRETADGGQPLLLPGQGDAHGALHALHDGVRIAGAFLGEPRVLLEPGHERALDAGERVLVGQLPVQLAQVDTGPEVVLEVFDLPLHPAQEEPALKDHHPGSDRGQHQGQHDQLHQQAGVGDQLVYG
jgi:hypothetical protein